MFRHCGARLVLVLRHKSKSAPTNEVKLSSKRVMPKIRLGKARPAIFYQFDTLVELSDGSVVRRRSQAPKDEIRMISDIRNSPLFNPHRSDLSVADPNATGKINVFQQRFGDFALLAVHDSKSESALSEHDDWITLMGQNAQEITTGKLLNTKDKKKK